MYATFSERLTFLTPWYAHVHVRIGGKKCWFIRKFCLCTESKIPRSRSEINHRYFSWLQATSFLLLLISSKTQTEMTFWLMNVHKTSAMKGASNWTKVNYSIEKMKSYGHLEISAPASRHQYRHWRRHRHRHFAKSLFLHFEVLYEETIYCEVLSKYTCWSSWEFQAMFRAVIL